MTRTDDLGKHTLGMLPGHRGAGRGRLESLDGGPRRAEAQPRSGGPSSPPHVRDTMMSHGRSPRRTARSPIVRTLLGLGDDREREMALKVAVYFDRYAPALPHLRDCPPGIHYHAVVYRGGFGTDPFGRFDTRI